MHDALKRRCLYYWIDYPDFQKEMQIITSRLPDAPRRLAEQVTGFVQEPAGNGAVQDPRHLGDTGLDLGTDGAEPARTGG